MARYNSAGRPSGATGNYTGGFDPRTWSGGNPAPVMTTGGVTKNGVTTGSGTVHTLQPTNGLPQPGAAGGGGGGGMTGGQAAHPFMSGLDMTKPGAAESYFANNLNRFQGPGYGVDWLNKNQGNYQNPGMGENFVTGAMNRFANGANTPQVTNNMNDWYQQFKGQQPNLSENLDPYYQRAEANATGQINKDMAARGLVGSTAASGEVSNAVGGLEADKANREGQYEINRAAELRNWQGLGGQLAQGADLGSKMQSDNALSWTTGLGDLGLAGQQADQSRINSWLAAALGVDASDLSRLNSGMQGSVAAQGAQTDRGQNAFMNEMLMGNTMSGLMGNAYNGMFGQDYNLMQDAMGGMAGSNSEASAENLRKIEAQWQDLQRAEGLMSGGMKMGMGA